MATSTGSVVKRTYGVQCQGQYSLLPFLTLITNVSSSEMCPHQKCVYVKRGKGRMSAKATVKTSAFSCASYSTPPGGVLVSLCPFGYVFIKYFSYPLLSPPPYKYRGVYIRIALSVFMSVHLSASHPVCLPDRVCRISPEPLNHF